MCGISERVCNVVTVLRRDESIAEECTTETASQLTLPGLRLPLATYQFCHERGSQCGATDDHRQRHERRRHERSTCDDDILSAPICWASLPNRNTRLLPHIVRTSAHPHFSQHLSVHSTQRCVRRNTSGYRDTSRCLEPPKTSSLLELLLGAELGGVSTLLLALSVSNAHNHRVAPELTQLVARGGRRA